MADEKYWYIVCADADCFMAVSETGVKADNITVNGQVTFHCEVTPTENLTIYILRLEVEQFCATIYESIQVFAPETWQHFYFNPTLSPFKVGVPCGLCARQS